MESMAMRMERLVQYDLQELVRRIDLDSRSKALGLVDAERNM